MTTHLIPPNASVCPFLYDMNATNRRGDLPAPTKKETADLMLQYAHLARDMNDRETLVVELPEGRMLTYYLIVFPAYGGLPELREWSVHLYTLKQRTPKCLRRTHERKAWLYLAPYTYEKGYKTDPTGKWSYRVWA